MTARPSTPAPILAALALLLLSLGAYVGGYYGLGHYTPSLAAANPAPEILRIYRAQWQYKIFVPLAWVESKVTRRVVTLVYEQNGDFLESLSISAGN